MKRFPQQNHPPSSAAASYFSSSSPSNNNNNNNIDHHHIKMQHDQTSERKRKWFLSSQNTRYPRLRMALLLIAILMIIALTFYLLNTDSSKAANRRRGPSQKNMAHSQGHLSQSYHHHHHDNDDDMSSKERAFRESAAAAASKYHASSRASSLPVLGRFIGRKRPALSLEPIPSAPIPDPPQDDSLCNYLHTQIPQYQKWDPFRYFFAQQRRDAEYISETYCRRRRRIDRERRNKWHRQKMHQKHQKHHKHSRRYKRKHHSIGPRARSHSNPIKMYIAPEVTKYFNRMEFDTNPKWTKHCSVPCHVVKKRHAADIIVNGFESHPKEADDQPHAKYAIISTEGINPDVIQGRNMEEWLSKQDITINYNPHSDVVIAIDTLGARATDADSIPHPLNPWYGRMDGDRWDWTPHVPTAAEIEQQPREEFLMSTFISNCAESIWKRGSIRNIYLKELGEHIPIRNYGKCSYGFKKTGKKQCASVSCKVKEQNKYKFSAAFQNTMQYGYVDEKIWDAVLSSHTVPVYWGAPDIEQYTPAPARKMMIIASDYSNPKELAEYLQYLDRNSTAYMEYFEWRTDGYNEQYEDRMKNSVSRYMDDDGNNISWLCRTCEFYHENYDW